MALLVDLIRLLAVVNFLLLLGLTSVWGRTWWDLRSKHAFGMTLFALFLIGENGLVIYFFVLNETLTAWITSPDFVPPIAQYAMLSLRLLEFGGLVFLSWITWTSPMWDLTEARL